MGEQVYEKRITTSNELDPEVAARRNALFKKYVTPFLNMIYRLCINYSYSSHTVQENYVEVLVNFYRRIETYDPSKPIRTWLHIVTKRQVYTLERKREAEKNKDFDNDIDSYSDEILSDESTSSNAMSIENYHSLYSDDILAVIDELKPCYRDALLLQEAGYTLKEIAEIEYQKGALKSKNIDTVKSRLRIAKDYLKNNLTRDGERISCKSDD